MREKERESRAFSHHILPWRWKLNSLVSGWLSSVFPSLCLSIGHKQTNRQTNKQTPPHCHYWNISQPWQPLWWSNPNTASLTLHSVTHIHFLSFQWQILNEMPHGVSWSSVWLAANSGLDPVLFWHGSSSSPQSGQLLSEPDSHGPCPTGRRYILKARGTRVAYVLGYLGIIQTVIQNTRTLQLYHRS